MSAVGEKLAVRVTVAKAWETVELTLDPDTSVAELKREALRQAVGESAAPEDFLVKYRGAEVFDEAATLAALAVPPLAPLIVVSRRRQPVR